MNRWGALAVLLIFAGALAFRLPRLDLRPLHNDEGVNALKVAELWEKGNYRYDPDEYHGPTLHYFTVPFLTLSGAANGNSVRDGALRYVTVAFGAGLILLLFLFRDGLGAQPVCWAALFIAISPAMVFYSRYFIHEMLLVFFTLLAIGAGWRYSQSRSPFWALLTGTAVGLMFATKETFVLTLAALGTALLCSIAWTKPKETSWKEFLAVVRGRDLAMALVAMLVVWLVFFSSFFSNFGGLLDSIRTYFPWLKRAAGHSPHLHPWYFYLERLGWFHPAKSPVWSEGLILVLAVIGAVGAFRWKGAVLPRFIVIYTVVLTAIYSVITYKTPWCMLNFYIGMILLAGFGAATLLGSCRSKLVKASLLLLLLAGAGQLSAQAWRANFIYASDSKNPYVYAQTVPDILKLVERVEGVAKISPTGYETILKVIATDGDYWPLPWYFRRFENVGWYETLPEDPFAPIIVVSAKFDARLDEKSERKWIMAGVSELRPGKFFELYVDLALWTKYVETLPREVEDE